MHLTAYNLRLLILLPLMLRVSFTDLKEHRIANSASMVLLLCGLLLPFLEVWDITLQEAVVALSLTFIVSFIAFMAGMGAGDAKLLTGLAAMLGSGIIPVALLAYVLAGVAALGMLMCKRITLQSRLPFAPALAIAVCCFCL